MTTVIDLVQTEPKEIIEIADDEISLDDEQIDEFREMVEELGSFPDKVKINTLSMIAGDHSESEATAKVMYRVIQSRLLSTTNHQNMLPLVYGIDAILKNCKGHYVELVENDAVEWMSLVYKKLNHDQKQKLQKVWKTWNEFDIFSDKKWKEIGRCFDDCPTSRPVSQSTLQIAGIQRMNDGKLLLSAPLRSEMQSILDEVQSGVENELDKVSLERVAYIDPDLLAKIKGTAEDFLRKGGSQGSSLASVNRKEPSETLELQLPPFLIETRTEGTIAQSKVWKELKGNYQKHLHDVVSRLQNLVRQGSSSEVTYMQQEALDLTRYLAAASATTSVLTSMLERIKKQKDLQQLKLKSPLLGVNNPLGSTGASVLSWTAVVDEGAFTNEGIKEKKETVIGLLYEIGLPFVSSVDGLRFRSEVELSSHLDAIFRRNQLEKTIVSTEDRGWYLEDKAWTGEVRPEDQQKAGAQASDLSLPCDKKHESQSSTEPADESRDRCAICGINFKMFFDNDDGIWKYSNCREMKILNDDAEERDSYQMLVHVTCWRGLGAPEVLTSDQTLLSLNRA